MTTDETESTVTERKRRRVKIPSKRGQRKALVRKTKRVLLLIGGAFLLALAAVSLVIVFESSSVSVAPSHRKS